MSGWRELWVPAADGTKLWVGVRGEGRPIVLCDGLGCDGYVWRGLEEELARDMRVVRWHYRSHGRSGAARDVQGLRVEEFARDLRRVLDRLALRDVVLAGHSLGVQVILEAALQEGALGRRRVTALVPMCGSSGRVLETFKGRGVDRGLLAGARRLVDREPARWRGVWSRLVPSGLSVGLTRELEMHRALVSAVDVRGYMERMAAMDPGALLATLSSAARHDVLGRLGQLEVPALVVAGERDTFTPVACSVRMVEHLRGSELFVLPDATHAGPLEWPDLVALRVRKFLRERSV